MTTADDDEILLNDNNNVGAEAEDDGDDPGNAHRSPVAASTTALQQRLRRLKQKMNQARQLNQQAVQHEAEALTAGPVVAQRQRAARRKQVEQIQFAATHQDAVQLAQAAGLADATVLTQQADMALAKTQRQLEKDELAQYSARDYHNPGGMHRNYVRSLKSAPQQRSSSTNANDDNDGVYNPLDLQMNDPNDQNAHGARRLAVELQRRYRKQQDRERKRRLADVVGDGDVGHISERNRKYNQKLSKHYDTDTAEIRHNLERGTAL